MLARYCALLAALLFWLPLSAHQFLPTDATLSVLSEAEYALVVDLDLIEIVQTVRGMEGEGQELVDAVRFLPFPQLTDALGQAQARLLDDIEVYVDDSPVALNTFEMPPQQDILLMLRRTDIAIDYRITAISGGVMPVGARVIQVQFPDYLGPVNLVVNSPRFLLVNAGDRSDPYDIPTGTVSTESAAAQVLAYFYQGIIHIIPQGLDHILFVLALFLSATSMGSLLWQVTAFTAAHTITLISATYGAISLPADVVEPLIAFSIAFVAVENLVQRSLTRRRIVVVFLFGLLHGLGFAAVLSGFGLPENQLFAGLVSFNVGVEVGQLLVIAIAFLLVGWFRRRRWYRVAVVLPASACIAIIGLVWTVQRIAQVL